MAQPRPSLTLILDIDERLDSEELRLELARCYAHVGTTLVRSHATGAEAGAGEPTNHARLLVKLGTRNYLHAGEEADQLWGDVLAHWFENAFHKIGNNMKAFNRRQRDIGGTELFFDWLEVELQNGELTAALHLDTASGIEPKSAAMLTVLRDAFNAGALGEEVARVLMPSPASYGKQVEAGRAAAAERAAAEEAAREAQEAEERAAREAAAAEAERLFLEVPEADMAEAGGVDAATVDAGETEADPFQLDEPDFAVDYAEWLVEYADGSARTFDSARSAFAD